MKPNHRAVQARFYSVIPLIIHFQISMQLALFKEVAFENIEVAMERAL